MDTCFIIQPFDKDKFDQRYAETFEPAIKAAGLEPYRVDRDPSVRIPIEQIEEGIKISRICFAEITLDNPNVWYELGYAFAAGKDVVMVTEERQKFPFDIQHKQVINYKTTSKGDYEKLENSIKEKLLALLATKANVQKIIENPVRESEGLKQHEITMLLLILENQMTDEHKVSGIKLQRDMDAAGFTKVASNIAFRELKNKKFIEQLTAYSEEGDAYTVFKLTQPGEDWIMKNQDQIQFTKAEPKHDLPF
ncbi:MAG TPA: hypothetical protein VG738_10675 [Chitinophagaceae bacterium]|nr:hypothetical protein [Chitinophagaceae bacterium]